MTRDVPLFLPPCSLQAQKRMLALLFNCFAFDVIIQTGVYGSFEFEKNIQRHL